MLKMSKRELLGALGAEKLTKDLVYKICLLLHLFMPLVAIVDIRFPKNATFIVHFAKFPNFTKSVIFCYLYFV